MATIGIGGTNPTYTQTLPGAATAPSTTSQFDIAFNAPFIRQLVAERVIEEPKMQQYITSSRSFFRGNEVIQDRTLLDNLQFGQDVLLIIEKDQNPFGLFQKSAMSYTALDSCRDMLSLNCSVPCINTMPGFDTLHFRFDTEYAWGVRACDKNRKFWDFDYFTRQYNLSRRAEEFGREVDLWNIAVADAIANPATTVDAKLAQVHPTHYWTGGGDVATNGRALISEAAWYMQTSFQDIDAKIIMPVEMAKALIQSVETPFGLNNTMQRINTFVQWDVPGYLVDEQVRLMLGTQMTVLILERSPWLTYQTTSGDTTTIVSQYPLWSTDGTKQYCMIVDPRYAYQFAIEGYHLNILPYDCDKLVRGMIDTEYVGSGTTFPIWALIIEFNAFSFV